MPDADLTQVEADQLIALPKSRVDRRTWSYPRGGGRVAIPLLSEDKREHFVLDLRRARIDLAKSTHQIRARQVVPLIRLCMGTAPHRNPDGEKIIPIHLHHYREGYWDKWAQPIPANAFRDLTDQFGTLADFMAYCNIIEPPTIQSSWIS